MTYYTEKANVDEDQQSEFNSAFATLRRINWAKSNLNLATVNDDYQLKFKFLKVYFFELTNIMNNKDDTAQKIRLEEIKKNYRKLMEAKMKGDKTISKSIIDSFDDWEIELRNIEQRYGMNMPRKPDPRYAMAGRSYRR